MASKGRRLRVGRLLVRRDQGSDIGTPSPSTRNKMRVSHRSAAGPGPRLRVRGYWERSGRTSLARPLDFFPLPHPAGAPARTPAVGEGSRTRQCAPLAEQRRRASFHEGACSSGARGVQARSEGGEGKARERSRCARPTQRPFLSSHRPPSAGWSVSRAGGRDAGAQRRMGAVRLWEMLWRRGPGGAPVPMRRSFHRRSRGEPRRGHSPAQEREDIQRVEFSLVPGAMVGTGLPTSVRAHAQAQPGTDVQD
jgi:hypothetical protein